MASPVFLVCKLLSFCAPRSEAFVKRPPRTKNYLNLTLICQISEVLSLILNLTQRPAGQLGLWFLARFLAVCQLGADVEVAENGI